MKKTVEFTDSELGNNLVTIAYDETKHDFVEMMNLAQIILYNIEDMSYEDMKEEFGMPSITKEFYNLAFEILDGGMNGVTTDRFLYFLEQAFHWNYEYVNPKSEYSYNVEYGHFNTRPF